MKKIFTSIIIAVISGVLIYWLTTGLKEKSSSPITVSVDDYKNKEIKIKVSYYDTKMLDEGQAALYLNGKQVGTFYISNDKTKSYVHATLPRAGKYEYTIVANVVMNYFTYESNGNGEIIINDDDHLVITTHNMILSPDGNTLFAQLDNILTLSNDIKNQLIGLER